MSAPSRSSRIVWLAFAVSVLALTVSWAVHVINGLSADDQRALVPTTTVWGMHACMVAVLAGLAGVYTALAGILGRRHLLIALALLVGGWLACGLAPQTNRIFFDEHLYMQIGQTIAHTGRAETANYARVEYGKFEMYSAWVNKQPNGLPYLLSWLYRIFGVSDTVSHFLNRALVGLSSATLYLGLTLIPWRLPPGSALAAGLLFIFSPLVLWWGHTVSVEPAAAATAVFAFFAACVHARLRDADTAQGRPAAGLLLAGATAFAAYFRPESLLVFPVVAAVLWSTEDRFIEDESAWGGLALALALVTPNLLHLWGVRGEDWGATDGRRFALDFVGKNLQSNGGYFFDSAWFPVAGTLLALAGIGWLLARNRSAGLVVGLWFTLSWGIFVLFYAGGYFYGASSRYAVVSCAPVAVFMGIGLAALHANLRRWPMIAGGLGAIVLINWASAMHYVPTLSRESAEARADVDFVAKVAPTLPEGSLVISCDPCMWQLKGVNSTQLFVIEGQLRGEMRELAAQYPGGIYYHWDYWHGAEPDIAKRTAALLEEVHGTVFARATSQSYKLGLFRIDTPEGLERFGGKVPPPQPREIVDMDAVARRAQEHQPASASSASPAPAPSP